MEVMVSWLQDCEDHIAGALETLAALVTDVVPALSFRPLSSSCPRTYRRRDPLFTFAHAVSPSVVPPSPLAHLDILPDPDVGRGLP